MLGAHSELATMGELHLWPHEIRAGGVRPCSCGAFEKDCPFWSEIRTRVNPLQQEGPGIDYFRERHDAGRTLRVGHLRSFRRTAGTGGQDEIAAYGRNNLAVVTAFRDVFREQVGRKPRWIVDASKDPYRLLWLVRSGLFDIKVIHMVKNPCAFVYSVTKDWIHGAHSDRVVKRLYRTARQSLAWTLQNHLIMQVAQHYLEPSQYLLVKYEELASEPRDAFSRICAFIGCSFEDEPIQNFRDGSVHTIAGNPMRYERKGIVLDERWKRRLPSASVTLTRIITAFAARRYGYSL